MPVVTSARVGSFVGTGVAAREKLRIPAAASARPTRITEPAIIQWTRSASGTANGKGSRRSETKPSKRAVRKSRGGRAMTPAVPVSFTCCLAGSIPMAAPSMLEITQQRFVPEDDNYGVILPVDNHGVNWGKL